MMAAYRTGDPYLTFAKQAGAVPQWATRGSHFDERYLFKTCSLVVLYGMKKQSLAMRIEKPTAIARDLIRMHRQTYRDFWRWADAVVDHATLHGSVETVFGWRLYSTPSFNPRSVL